jgi:hypothetical protein
MARTPLIVMGMLAVAATGVARADTAAVSCPSGKAVTLDGHCCWRGQQWSSALKACTGTPSCPQGMRAAGTSCVPNGCSAAPASPPQSGHLAVSSVPKSAVYIDDKFAGYTPLATGDRFALAPGRHQVRLLVDGYGAQQRDVEIVAGETTRLYVNFEPPPTSR